MGPPLRVDELREAIRKMTDEEFDEIIAEMVADGILDEDGNVLKKFPPPLPDWITETNGHAGQGAPSPETARDKKPRRKPK